MKNRNVLLGIMSFSLISCLISGCTSSTNVENTTKSELKECNDVVVTIPEWSEVDESLTYNTDTKPIPLDQLEIYRDSGFRDEFDRIFEIETVNTDGMIKKHGCIYVVSRNGEDVQENDTTMHDAFRNKKFVSEFDKTEIKQQLAKSAELIYIDINESDPCAVNASVNAYFGIILDEREDPTYGGSRSLTRDQFNRAVYLADHTKIDIDKIEEMSWLQSDNGSLTDKARESAISKMEALYTVTNVYFRSKANTRVDNDERMYGYSSAGDLAYNIGAKKLGEEDKTPWQSIALAHMIEKPADGIQNRFVRSLITADELNLLDGIDTTDMFSSLTKNDAIQLLSNVYRAENKAYEFNTGVESNIVTHNQEEQGDVPQQNNQQQGNQQQQQYYPPQQGGGQYNQGDDIPYIPVDDDLYANGEFSIDDEGDVTEGMWKAN